MRTLKGRDTCEDVIVKVSGTSLYSKIKFENEVTIEQVFPSRRLVIDLLTRLTG